MKRIFLLVTGLTLTMSAHAEGVASPVKAFWNDPLSDPMFPVYVVLSFVFVVMLLVLTVAIYMVQIVNLFVAQAEEAKARAEGKQYRKKQSLWNRMWQRLNASVPVDRETDIELDHNFDGIRELDNHLPPWWKWLFYGTIGWAAVYLVIYHVSASLPLSEQEYSQEVAIAREASEKYKAAQPAESIDENTLVFNNDRALIEKGKQVFTNNCASCHKENGAGGIGPNLTDDYWLHGGDIKNIYGTIKNGVTEKGMIAWGGVLKPEEIRNAAFFVMSLHGSNPPGAKAPQGELIKHDDKVDSLKQASL